MYECQSLSNECMNVRAYLMNVWMSELIEWMYECQSLSNECMNVRAYLNGMGFFVVYFRESYYAERHYVFHQEFVCVCVCVSVCLSVITFAARWLDLATWRQVRSILSTRTWKCNTSQDDPFPIPFNMDHRYKITFWPVTSKLMDGFTPNFTCM